LQKIASVFLLFSDVSFFCNYYKIVVNTYALYNQIAAVSAVDTSGIAFLMDLKKSMEKRNIEVQN